MLFLVDGLAVVGRVNHNRFLIAKLVNHPAEEGIHIQNRVIIGIDQLLLATVLVNADALRRPFGEIARVTLIVAVV